RSGRLEAVEKRVQRAPRMKASVEHRYRRTADPIVDSPGDEQQRIASRLKIEPPAIRLAQPAIVGIGVGAVRRLTRLLVDTARQDEAVEAFEGPAGRGQGERG